MEAWRALGAASLVGALATCQARPASVARPPCVVIRAKARPPPPRSAQELCVALASTSPALRAEVELAAREARARLRLRAHPLGVDLEDTPPEAALMRFAPRLLSMVADTSLALRGAAIDAGSGDEVSLSTRGVPSSETRCAPPSLRDAMAIWPVTRSLHLRFQDERARRAAELALAERASWPDGLVSAVIPQAIDRVRCAQLLTWARETLGDLTGEAMAPTSAPVGDAVALRWTHLGPRDLLVVPRALALNRLGAFAQEVLTFATAAAPPGAVDVVQ